MLIKFWCIVHTLYDQNTIGIHRSYKLFSFKDRYSIEAQFHHNVFVMITASFGPLSYQLVGDLVTLVQLILQLLCLMVGWMELFKGVRLYYYTCSTLCLCVCSVCVHIDTHCISCVELIAAKTQVISMLFSSVWIP